MKKLISVLLVISMCAFFAGCGKGEHPESTTVPDTTVRDVAAKDAPEEGFAPENYTLSYADEFNGELDETVWKKDGFYAHRGGYWSPDQIKLEKGKMVIETAYIDDEEYPGYYSGEIFWNKKRSTYGYYETRCKVENVRGIWSAFWLQPDVMGKKDGKATDGAEIDIFESALPNLYQNAIHYDAYAKRAKKTMQSDSLYDVYHVYAVDWKKDSLRFYCDGELTWEITDPNLVSSLPVSMHLSTEILGVINGEGVPAPDPKPWPNCGDIRDSQNKLPSKFIVDYVRVYDNGDLIWS